MSDKVSFGRRLAPIVVADIAREQPHKLYGSIARTSNPQDGLHISGLQIPLTAHLGG